MCVALVVTDCGDRDDAPPATTDAPAAGPWTVERPATIRFADCPEGADCLLGFDLDGAFVEYTCLPVVEGVTDATIAVGDDEVPLAEARAIAGVSTGLLVALPNVLDACDTTRPWVAGVVHDPDRSLGDELALSLAACRSLHAPHRADQSCEEGGPALYSHSLDADTIAYELAWFPDVVARVDAEIASGLDSPHADPVRAIAHFEEQHGFPDCFVEEPHRQLCRIGHAPVPDRPAGPVVVDGVTQTRYADVGFDSQAFAWTVERVGGGPGWWVTRRTHEPFAYLTDDEADRTWQACCPEVVVTTGDRPR